MSSLDKVAAFRLTICKKSTSQIIVKFLIRLLVGSTGTEEEFNPLNTVYKISTTAVYGGCTLYHDQITFNGLRLHGKVFN